jgi:hypothetical protein
MRVSTTHACFRSRLEAEASLAQPPRCSRHKNAGLHQRARLAAGRIASFGEMPACVKEGVPAAG